MPPDHYKTLRVARTASEAELRRAYLKLAREHHPDRFDDGERASAELRMQAINEAWSVLGTPHKRTEYDRTVAMSRGTGTSTGSTGRGRSDFRPFDDEPVRRADADLDPTPIPGSRAVPQWISMMPVVISAGGLVMLGLGLLLNAGAIIAIAAAALVLGAVAFLALPLFVMSRAERDPDL